MRRRTLVLLVLGLSVSATRLEAACIEPTQLAHTAVSITHYFDDHERAAAKPGVIGMGGTAWFLSPSTVVTAEHVSAGMRLSTQDWKPLEIRDGDEIRSVPARVERVMGIGPEKLAVLALQSEFLGAR